MSESVATPEQIADELQISHESVLWLKENCGLPFIMVNRTMWRVPWFAYHEWLRSEVARCAMAGLAEKEAS